VVKFTPRPLYSLRKSSWYQWNNTPAGNTCVSWTLYSLVVTLGTTRCSTKKFNFSTYVYNINVLVFMTGKGKVHPLTCHECPEGVYRYSSTLSLTSMSDRDGCSAPRPSRLTREDPVLIPQEVGWAPRPVWTVATSLFPTWIRSPDCPARCESLCPLRYPSPFVQDRGGVNYKYKTKSHFTRSTHIHGSRGGAVGWGTALQAGRSWVRFPLMT